MVNSDICVIFDLDGTLVDSEGLCNQAFLDLLPQLDESLESLMERYRGKKLAPILVDLESRLCQKLPDGFEADYREHVAALFLRALKPMPGVPEMLSALDLPRCVASSGPLLKVHQALQVSGLASFFGSHIFSAYDVGSWKPEPGLFLHAAKAMGFKPYQCVVVEDSNVGVEAAIAAGMTVFQYVRHDALVTCRSKGHVIFDDMLKLPVLLAALTKLGDLSFNGD